MPLPSCLLLYIINRIWYRSFQPKFKSNTVINNIIYLSSGNMRLAKSGEDSGGRVLIMKKVDETVRQGGELSSLLIRNIRVRS
jgi:hypothetical protein